MEFKNNYCNIPKSIEEKIGKNLFKLSNHPIEIIKNKIYKYFDNIINFYKFEDFSPFVTIEDNFDSLLIPINHPARSKSDTYYVNENLILRTHTTAHQNYLLKQNYRNFLIVGDVYRKDEIDKNHYPIFHQMEGVVEINNDLDPKNELKKILGGLVEYLFPNCEYRIKDDYFPFTDPSYEIEVLYNQKWLEILGSGIMHKQILQNNNLDKNYVAFGLGLDRLAMILFNIPDIRYLWSSSSQFLDQFKNGNIVEFKPYSNLPIQSKDISFWILYEYQNLNNKYIWNEENNFFELVREICGELVENVKLIDEFFNLKINKYSRTYRIIFSPNDPNINNPSEFTKICNNLQKILGENLEKNLKLKLR